MFKKILIANRGEIACRIMRTAQAMDIKCVAVYSDADAQSMHVEMADEALHIGSSPVSESYLRGEKIIQAALATGAEAIHPGYGFLSENPDFVDAVEAAGLVFIGPSAKAIRAMGLKDAAKALMEKAKVPVVPGYHGDMQEPGFLAAKANEIGFPVLIKARAGGGGKGMRRVDDPKQFSSALASCRSEARASFGDDRVLVEKYILNPRHIEIQVFGDNHGNVVHLFERDCSLQRRHQKVIEEAPAPGMTNEMREAMTSAAVKAAKAINYSGAGTIEFIVDGSNGLRPDGFWFMEMNTRLQVEHPVTEEITGLDLVELQLRVAFGEPLPLKQADITINGHAFEARLYAEDVPKGFLPAIGKLEYLRFANNVRIDTGVREKDAISPFYDPMIAKVISYGNNREVALGALNAALRHTQIAGTVTNKAFLASLCLHSEFSTGIVDTGLIERDIEKLTITRHQTPQTIVYAALAARVSNVDKTKSDPFSNLGNFSLWGERSQYVSLRQGGSTWKLEISQNQLGKTICRLNDELYVFDAVKGVEGNSEFTLISSGKETRINIARWPNHVAIFQNGDADEFEVIDPLASFSAENENAETIVSPMPGLVKVLNAKVGDEVKRGDPLIVLEAMKMEHTLTAPRDGMIAEINVRQGDQVLDGAILLRMAEEIETAA